MNAAFGGRCSITVVEGRARLGGHSEEGPS